jgi:hypothetical protein
MKRELHNRSNWVIVRNSLDALGVATCHKIAVAKNTFELSRSRFSNKEVGP